MWPCDPWLTGRDRWGHGRWGYSRGEPTAEDYPRSAWYAGFMCARLLVWMCVNRLAAGSCWLAWCDWREDKEETRCDVITRVSALNLSTTFTSGTIWPFLVINLFVKTSTWPQVSMQRDREYILRMHPSRVPFQFLRWIRGKWLIYRLSAWRGKKYKEHN